VSAVDPFPANAGKKVVLAGFINYFIERVGPENVHYLMIGGEPHPKFPAEFHPLPKPSAMSALASVMIRSATGRASIQESLLRSAQTRRAVQRTLQQVDASLEVFDTVRMSQFGLVHGYRRRVCYLDDLFSERYRAMRAAVGRLPDSDIRPLGNFAAHVPSPLRPVAECRGGQRLLLRIEERLVRRSEDRAVENYPAAVLLNEREAEILRGRSGCDAQRVVTVPPLIHPPARQRRYSGAAEFVFLGQLSLPHNDDGLRWFLTNVWPLVVASRSDARLRVVGLDPRPGLIELARRNAGAVTFEGFVADLAALLGRSAAMINPLRFGSGIKIKIIEALGAGLPVVSTSVGADGVKDGDEEGVLVSDDPRAMAERLLATTNVRFNEQLSEAATEHFSRCYSREAVFKRYDEVFGLH